MKTKPNIKDKPEGESTLNYMNKAVASILDASSDTVVDRFIEQQAEKEIASRVTKLDKLITAMTAMQTKLGSIAPDVLTYDEAGEVATSNYSKGLSEKRQSFIKHLEQGEEALKFTFDNNNYDKLEAVTKAINALL